MVIRNDTDGRHPDAADAYDGLVDAAARKAHWERVWSERTEREVSWFEPRPDASLRAIMATGVPHSARILDAGGGASRLVDGLMAAGFTDLTVADVSAHGLERARERLGADAERVTWCEADLLHDRLPGPFDVWHDRAVFHFLTSPDARRAYVANMERHLAPYAHVVVAAFAPGGPERCSGLPVMPHDARSIAQALGPGFRLAGADEVDHRTPSGEMRRFTYVRFWRRTEEGEPYLRT